MAADLQALLSGAESIYRDREFEAVQRWKKETGGLAVGYMPIYVPCELFHAQGVLPVGVVGGGEDLEIIRGDAYYQSYICHIPRSTIELGLNGSLDCLDGMIFPAICDVIRNLSGDVEAAVSGQALALLRRAAELRPAGRRPVLPARAGGALGRADRGEAPRATTPEALRSSIGIYNENRKLVREAYALRREHAVEGADRGACTSSCAPVSCSRSRNSRDARRLLAAVREDDSRRPMDQARVVLVGSFCEQPPLGLIKTLERSGCYIVDDDLVQVHRWLQQRRPRRRRSAREPRAGFPRRCDRQPHALRGRRRRERASSWSSGSRRVTPKACCSARRASATRRCSTSR